MRGLRWILEMVEFVCAWKSWRALTILGCTFDVASHPFVMSERWLCEENYLLSFA